MPVLVDTNIIVRCRETRHPEHVNCVQALRLLVNSTELPVVCSQVLIEFWATATRPTAANGLGLSTAAADDAVTELLETIDCLPEPSDIFVRWRVLVRQASALGRQVFDARLAALMKLEQIPRLLTLNGSDFVPYPFITAVTPVEIIAQHKT
jgi:predicted nucleic acid-binding protein